MGQNMGKIKIEFSYKDIMDLRVILDAGFKFVVKNVLWGLFDDLMTQCHQRCPGCVNEAAGKLCKHILLKYLEKA